MIVAVIGVRSQGKSTLSAYFSRVTDKEIILDTRNQFPAGDHEIYEYFPGELPLDEVILSSTARRVVIRPSGALGDAVSQLGFDLAEFLYAYPGVSISVVIDEAGNSTTRKLLDVDPWDRLFRTHPRKTAWFYICTHRPIDVPTNVRALIDWWACFRVNLPNDIEFLEKQCGPDYAAQVQTLKEREWLLYDSTKLTDRIKLYEDPTVWYMPLDDPQVMAGPRQVER